VTIHLKTAWSNQAGKMIRPVGQFVGCLTANETTVLELFLFFHFFAF